MITNLFVESGDTKPDHDLIYIKKLKTVLPRILLWYFDTGKEILDVTAGENRIWNDEALNGSDLSGKKLWNITFSDISTNAKTNIISDFKRLPFTDNSFDIIIFDPPFLRPNNGIEGFGIKTHKTPHRLFYFRQVGDKWVPPEAFFFQTWKEFNRISRNGLIVKISERYENMREIPVITYMDLAYDKIFNKKSQFARCVNVGYRGMRAGMGGRMTHAQRVLTYYAVYKKNPRQR